MYWKIYAGLVLGFFGVIAFKIQWALEDIAAHLSYMHIQ
jgi:hypothetical protein